MYSNYRLCAKCVSLADNISPLKVSIFCIPTKGSNKTLDVLRCFSSLNFFFHHYDGTYLLSFTNNKDEGCAKVYYLLLWRILLSARHTFGLAINCRIGKIKHKVDVSATLCKYIYIEVFITLYKSYYNFY